MPSKSIPIPLMSEAAAKGESPEVLFWVGCAGSFDDRAQRVTAALVKILHKANVRFAVLGPEESCTGDPARRAGNEFLFQMTAMQNIQVLNGYSVKRIVTACPHCFNILKNEYPALGGEYNVVHHSTFLQELIDQGRLLLSGEGVFKGKRITFHDSCYLGRANGVYEAPRHLIKKLDADLHEMRSCKSRGLCCGAGGAQMFKDEEPGSESVNIARTEEALETRPDIIAAGCPFCMTMMQDGVKMADREHDIAVYDVAELLAMANGLI